MGARLVPRDLHFNVNGITLAAQAWGHEGGLPILALHGWLDNSASFNRLIPLLQMDVSQQGHYSDFYIVALDLAGHGQSGHRLGQSSYTLWDDINDVFTVADQLGWHQFSLLGHSRGGIVGTLAAGTFPQRINALALIEGFIPDAAAAEDAPQQLANALQGLQTYKQKPRSIYPTIELAIKARARGMFPLSMAAAKALTERGIKMVPEGVYWSTDPLLLAPSVMKLTQAQIHAFVNRITAPINLLLGDGGLPQIYPNYLAEVALFGQVNTKLLSGGHHLHMESQVQEVALHLNYFFSKLSLHC